MSIPFDIPRLRLPIPEITRKYEKKKLNGCDLRYHGTGRTFHRWRCREGGGGGCSPPKQFLFGGAHTHISVPKESLAKHKKIGLSRHKSFYPILLGGIILCRTFPQNATRRGPQYVNLYLTLPVESATFERTFSALRRLKNDPKSTSKPPRFKTLRRL